MGPLKSKKSGSLDSSHFFSKLKTVSNSIRTKEEEVKLGSGCFHSTIVISSSSYFNFTMGIQSLGKWHECLDFFEFESQVVNCHDGLLQIVLFGFRCQRAEELSDFLGCWDVPLGKMSQNEELGMHFDGKIDGFAH